MDPKEVIKNEDKDIYKEVHHDITFNIGATEATLIHNLAIKNIYEAFMTTSASIFHAKIKIKDRKLYIV